MVEKDILKKQDKQDLQAILYHDKCDKYDYLIAAGCGAVAGMVDIFLVGAPTENAILSKYFY